MIEHKYETVNGLEHFFVSSIAEDTKPTILYVHGGPARTEALFLWEMQSTFGDAFNFIIYDMRGTGRTFEKNTSALPTYEQIEKDLSVIADKVYDRYGSFFIMGHDFGSIPAIRYARNNPKRIKGYIGYGQSVDGVNLLKTRALRVREIAEMAGKKGDVKAVDAISENTKGSFKADSLNAKDAKKLSKLLSKYSLAFGIDKKMMRRMAFCPIYEMMDLRVYMSSMTLAKPLLEYERTVSLFEESTEYKVPLLFISGDFDYENPVETVKEYVDKVQAPKKEIFLLEDTGNNAMFDAPELFWGKISEFVNEQ